MDIDTKVNLYIRRENETWNQPKPSLPVTLVTGFLGSGVTRPKRKDQREDKELKNQKTRTK